MIKSRTTERPAQLWDFSSRIGDLRILTLVALFDLSYPRRHDAAGIKKAAKLPRAESFDLQIH
jgi:hypothetical protein